MFHALNAANGEFVAVKKLPTKYADAGAILDIEVNANKNYYNHLFLLRIILEGNFFHAKAQPS